MTFNYHFYMQGNPKLMLSTDLQLSLLQAKVWNLKISNVKFSTDLQLSHLHAKVCNLKFSSLMFSNYHFYVQKYVIWKFQL